LTSPRAAKKIIEKHLAKAPMMRSVALKSIRVEAANRFIAFRGEILDHRGPLGRQEVRKREQRRGQRQDVVERREAQDDIKWPKALDLASAWRITKISVNKG
jgi:hypothetical protein